MVLKYIFFDSVRILIYTVFLMRVQVIPMYVYSIEDSTELTEDNAKGKNLKDWLMLCL